MVKLISILTIVFIIFTIICILFCIEAYFRYRRKIGIDEDKNYTNNYKYFVQKIYDKNDKLTAYELLLREYNYQEKQWQLPKDVNNFPLNLVAEAVEKQHHQFADDVGMLTINMTVSQLADYRAGNFLNWVMGVLPNKIIVLELDINDVLNSNLWRRRRLMKDLEILARNYPNIQVTIEGVNSSKYHYKKLVKYLPWVDYIKFNASAFNKSNDHWIDVTLAQWQRKLKKYSVKDVLARIEDENQATLAQQLKVNYRQGYHYQKPQQIK